MIFQNRYKQLTFDVIPIAKPKQFEDTFKYIMYTYAFDVDRYPQRFNILALLKVLT